jgi:hypothetical protein
MVVLAWRVKVKLFHGVRLAMTSGFWLEPFQALGDHGAMFGFTTLDY